MRILLIEDEHRLAKVIATGLREDGFAVDMAEDGEEGLFMGENESYDLIILDLMLPKLDGLSVCRSLRTKKIITPILMLTAKAQVEDRVAGLDSGADDYLTKPFAFAELKSRVNALIRRSNQRSTNLLTIADLELDPTKHVVKRSGKNINLTPKEFSILEFLLSHQNEVVSRTMIMEHVWDYNFEGMSNVVDVFVASLRRKVDSKCLTKLIHTVHGVGYKISVVP